MIPWEPMPSPGRGYVPRRLHVPIIEEFAEPWDDEPEDDEEDEDLPSGEGVAESGGGEGAQPCGG